MSYEVESFLRRLGDPDATVDNAARVPHGQRPCPICGQRMAVDEELGIQTDVCQEHGVWLDADELKIIMSRVREQEEGSKVRAVRDAKRDGVRLGANRGIWAFLYDF